MYISAAARAQPFAIITRASFLRFLILRDDAATRNTEKSGARRLRELMGMQRGRLAGLTGCLYAAHGRRSLARRPRQAHNAAAAAAAYTPDVCLMRNFAH